MGLMSLGSRFRMGLMNFRGCWNSRGDSEGIESVKKAKEERI